MDAVKRKLCVVHVLLHGITSLLRTAPPKIEAVEERFPRRGRKFPRRGRFFPRHLRFVPRLPARTGRGGRRNAGRRGACCGVGEGTRGVLRAINMLLSMFGAICRPFSCKSRIFFSHLQSAVKKSRKFFSVRKSAVLEGFVHEMCIFSAEGP